MTDKQELLGCPFCGGEAEIITDNENMHAVYCGLNVCLSEPHVWSNTRHGAIKAWNTRASGWRDIEKEVDINKAPWDGNKVLISGGTYIFKKAGNADPLSTNVEGLEHMPFDDPTDIILGYFSGTFWRCDHEVGDGEFLHCPTHWMPLPSTPTGE